MTSRARLLSTALAGLVLWPAAASAQQGPSFDCGYASTATEFAICGSEDLATLERRMVQVYEELAARIGRREARAVADGQLAIRQACRGDYACIAGQLVDTIAVFEREGGFRVAEAAPRSPEAEAPLVEAPVGEPEIAAEDILRALPPGFSPPGREALASVEPEPLTAGEPEIPAEDILSALPEDFRLPVREEVAAAAAEVALPEAALPEAAAAPLPEELAALEEPGLGGLALEEAELTSTAEDVPPLTQAFAALSPEGRAEVQGRLLRAGYYDGPADGEWSLLTEAALRRFFADAITAGEPVDSSTLEGATRALGFVASDAFEAEYLAAGETAPKVLGGGEFQW